LLDSLLQEIIMTCIKCTKVAQLLRQSSALNLRIGTCLIAKRQYSDEGGYSDLKQTHFGFQTVGEAEKRDKVLSVFHNVADKYDMMNDVMSAGVHRIWKDYFVSKINPNKDMKLLDVAGGTGDIAFRFLDSGGGSVVVCDINPSMLGVGQDRARDRGYLDSQIKWQEGDAQALPFDDNSFDCYTIAFGIRNVVKIDAALKEARRVLKPGGRFLCLEFSKVTVPGLDVLYNTYSFQIIPPLGHVIAGDWNSYQYLVESIQQFPDQETFSSMIREAGFGFVKHENLTGGIAAVHSAFKL